MAKYNYSLERTNAKGQKEVLQVVNCDSFDEAIKIVEKADYNRGLTEMVELEHGTESGPDQISNTNNGDQNLNE